MMSSIVLTDVIDLIVFRVEAVEMLGYKSSADLIGQNVKLIMPEPHHSNHDSTHKEEMQKSRRAEKKREKEEKQEGELSRVSEQDKAEEKKETSLFFFLSSFSLLLTCLFSFRLPSELHSHGPSEDHWSPS